jgi:hypothetical protein
MSTTGGAPTSGVPASGASVGISAVTTGEAEFRDIVAAIVDGVLRAQDARSQALTAQAQATGVSASVAFWNITGPITVGLIPNMGVGFRLGDFTNSGQGLGSGRLPPSM